MGAVGTYLGLAILTAADVQWTDIHRFPGPDAVRHAATIYQARIGFLNYQQAWYPREYWFWQDRIDEMERYHKAWGCLGSAHNATDFMRAGNPNWGPADVNQSLSRLRELIGEANYAAGQMPGPP